MDLSIDQLGQQLGTDKSSLYRDHLRQYELFLHQFGAETFDLLEVGVGEGASLRLWCELFPRARIIGLDVRRLVITGLPPRCSVVHGSQTDIMLLHSLVRRFRFRLVIDDGSHRSGDQILTFDTLFPWLERGGVYICESVCHEPSESGAESAYDHFRRFADTVATVATEVQNGDRWQSMAAHATSVAVTRNCVVVTA